MTSPTNSRFTGPMALGLLLVLCFGPALAGCGNDAPPPADHVPVDPEGAVDEAPPPVDPELAPEPEMAPDLPSDTSDLELPEPPLEAPPIFPPPDLPMETADPDEEFRAAEGVLGVTGTETTPTAVLQLDDGSSLGLTGAPARELMRLSGARARVEGRRAATPVGPGIEVSAYQLLEIEGRTPHLGLLQQGADGRWILLREDRDALPLTGLPGDRMQDGMKIWVIGETDATGRFRVGSYGIVSVGGT